MKNKRRLINHLQNTVISVLAVLAVLLFCQAAFFDLGTISKSVGSIFKKDSDPAGIVSVSDVKVDAAQPLYILVTAETGAHYATKFGEERETMLSRFSTTLGEAIGTISGWEYTSEDYFQNAARGTGVFFDYVFDQSLDFIAKGLGTACPESLSQEMVRRMMLSVENGGVNLYFSGDSGYYRCATALAESSLSSKISECPIGMAQFAFELGDSYENLDPYFIFTNEELSVPDITASNPVTNTQASRELLACFGINIGTVLDHTEADGSTVYVDSDMSLRFGIDGYLIFTASGSGGIAVEHAGQEPTVSEMLTACAQISKSIYSYFNLDPVLGVTEISELPDSYSLSFGNLVNGIPVRASGTIGVADFDITNGKITRIEIMLRSYETVSVNTSSPLAEKQTAAIVEMNGGEPVLVYVDDNTASPVVSWTTVF